LTATEPASRVLDRNIRTGGEVVTEGLRDR
jgi:hypothetical protein